MTSTATASLQPPPPGSAPRQARGAADALPVLPAEIEAADGVEPRGTAAVLTEAALHRRAATPLAIGIFGPAGSGKSRFIADMLDTATRLAEGARNRAAAGPFVADVVVARVSPMPGREPAASLVGGLLDALGAGHAAFAEDAVHAGGDPREAERLAGERVNALRRKLDGERQALDDVTARRARLTESVLFDGAGSRVDAFARANRARIEGRLRAFGLPASDPIRSFKELVRDAAEPGGPRSRLGLTLGAIWRFKGQGSLIAVAVLLAALGWAAGSWADDPATVSAWLSGFGDHFTTVTDWARGHLDLLQPVSRIALALAVLALLAVLVRAARFLGPVYRGIALLKGDLGARRRDLDGLLAHQTRRVDALATDVETAGRGAEAAQRRAEGHRGAGLSDHGAALAADLFGLVRSPAEAAERFFATLSAGISVGREDAPQRIVVAVDGLDGLAPAELAGFLATAHRLLARPGFVWVAGLERDAAAAALGEFDPAAAAARLDRMVQISYDLGAVTPEAGPLAQRLLVQGPAETRGARTADPARSSLDRPFEPFEAEVVGRLAPFTGGMPRAVERFVQGYRVARADPRLDGAPPASFAMLALGLALDGTGGGSELSTLDHDLGRGRSPADPASDVGRAFAAAASALPQGLAGGDDLRRGLAVARSYGRRG